MAAADTSSKKRKGATDAAPKAKRSRKSDDVASPVQSKAAKAKASRSQAADFFSDDEAAPASSVSAKATKSKRAAKNKAAAAVVDTPVEAPKEKAKKAVKRKEAEEDIPVVEETASKKAKKTKASKKQAEPEEVAEVTEETNGIALDVEEDDQTAALLAGFESDEEVDPDEDDGFDEDAKVPALTKKQKSALAKADKSTKSTEPGVVYVGRVPRGFFEPQMKKYFSQFGRVTQLRLSRNKKTGASKHYGFVEFASAEVADIVARTMDNYLLFGHILKCKVIPSDQVREDLFKGAGERFKVDPRNKKAGLEMERGVERAQWDKRVQKENKRRSGKAKALKEDFGYEYEAPKVKSAKDAPKQLENGGQVQVEDALQEVPAIEEAKPKLGRKAAKMEPVAAAAEHAAPKAKKEKKRKSDVTAEPASEDLHDADAAPKVKKSKKDAKKKTTKV